MSGAARLLLMPFPDGGVELILIDRVEILPGVIRCATLNIDSVGLQLPQPPCPLQTGRVVIVPPRQGGVVNHDHGLAGGRCEGGSHCITLADVLVAMRWVSATLLTSLD